MLIVVFITSTSIHIHGNNVSLMVGIPVFGLLCHICPAPFLFVLLLCALPSLLEEHALVLLDLQEHNLLLLDKRKRERTKRLETV